MALNHDLFWTVRPMCDVKGCEMVSSIHCFGRHVCMGCYARLFQNGGFYSLTTEEKARTMQAVLTEKKTCGRVGQLELEWGETSKGA
jgi:hypothetical protein